MSSQYSTHWSPTQLGYLQVPTEIGSLFYHPLDRPLASFGSGPYRFVDRNQRPYRVHTSRIRSSSRPSQPPTRPSPARSSSAVLFDKTFEKTFGKLAIPRDNTRRFLKSLTAPSSLPNQPITDPLATNAATEVDSRPRRRSWLGKRLTETETMRTSIRGSVVEPPSQVPVPLAEPEGMSPTMPQPQPVRNWSVSTASSARRQSSCRIPAEKPLASGNGVSVGISLAEPVLFLQGFDQAELAQRSTAMLRGSLHLKITKASKIKAVSLKFKGTAITKWPEGIPPKKQDTEEIDTIMSHTWPFFNAQFPTAEFGSCADHVELTRTESPPDEISFTPAGRPTFTSPFKRSPMNSSTNLSKQAKSEHKRLSLQVNQSQSFGKGDNPRERATVAQKGYRTFAPGDYIYNFEFPLDSHIPETIDVDLGSVKYELEATVERAGAFKANLVGVKEILLIRTPAEGSLEQVEPIAISRNWEDQLHYDIVISGKSFPLGAQVPIAFKLTPLAKVQCHRIKVLVTENIEYYCSNKRVHRMGGTRKVQLFEKRADGPSTSAFPGSSMRVLSGGGLSYDQRMAAAQGQEVVVENATNLLGDLESGQSNIGPTEMEFNVQLPKCDSMQGKEREQRLHFDTTYQNIQVHHWIKIVMRLSKPDAENPAKRRHFEISIDSPFHILSCRATQANIALPAYSSPHHADANDARLYECGCPGAAQRSGSMPSSYMPTLNNLNADRDPSPEGHEEVHVPRRTETNESIPGLQRPQAAHVVGLPRAAAGRPMHLLRAPSFNPPAFEAEQPPPPLETPPPMYETIASPTSGLADYFARLSDAYEANSDHEGGSSDTDQEIGNMARNPRRALSRLPLTPGGRVARSMDEQRHWTPVGEEPPRLTIPIR